MFAGQTDVRITLALQYMHSLNFDIEKMEEEIRQLNVEATVAVAENKGKDDHWQQVFVRERGGGTVRERGRDMEGCVCAVGCVWFVCCRYVTLMHDVGSEQIKVNTMERVNKLSLQDEQLKSNIDNTQHLIKSLDIAARGICR